MSLGDKIQLASQQLATTYQQLGELQEELVTLIQQEQERINRLENEELKKIATTFDKLSEYQEKLVEITQSMVLIDKRSQKLKRRAIYVEEQVKKPS